MDSKRLCNDVIQTQIDLVVYVTTFPAYIFLKTFIQSLLTFRYLLSGVNFTYGVSVLTSLSFSLAILECSFIVSLTSVYPQHQRRNISFSPHLFHQSVFVKFWIMAILSAVRRFLPVVSICIPNI